MSVSPHNSHHTYITEAINEGCTGVKLGDGGPFGAVIVRDGTVIATGHNLVLQTNDPTAHAEMVAIRRASEKLGRFSLHDCVIYASCQPCPMCLSAIIWAKIPKCFYSSSPDDAAAAGFDDRFLYDFIRGKLVPEKCTLVHISHSASNQPFDIYSRALKSDKTSLY